MAAARGLAVDQMSLMWCSCHHIWAIHPVKLGERRSAIDLSNPESLLSYSVENLQMDKLAQQTRMAGPACLHVAGVTLMLTEAALWDGKDETVSICMHQTEQIGRLTSRD